MHTTRITWKIHCASSPARIYELLDTDAGRKSFWAEEAPEENGIIHFTFPNGTSYHGSILARTPDRLFALMYFDSKVTFELDETPSGGTDLTLTDEHVPVTDLDEVRSGWVSVLMALKARADFDIDLRNHDPDRTWDHGFADN